MRRHVGVDGRVAYEPSRRIEDFPPVTQDDISQVANDLGLEHPGLVYLRRLLVCDGRGTGATTQALLETIVLGLRGLEVTYYAGGGRHAVAYCRSRLRAMVRGLDLPIHVDATERVERHPQRPGEVYIFDHHQTDRDLYTIERCSPRYQPYAVLPHPIDAPAPDLPDWRPTVSLPEDYYAG